ncbi:hypothetical protein PASE110613_08805 [Paenibacillus sediminis]|uniref:Uncharacterized protein n=1 Tax=Paenibacillus sediminis TaxID=664909 RepID=A0ABS4H779_9BACL|nr:hypothetical protein [Paenibacillus sediminis]MBP1938092.1 hypothetical protein [Paenibacillus sediminis]
MKNKTTWLTSIFVVIFVMTSLINYTPAYAGAKFGDVPTDDVLSAATANYKGTGTTRNSFAAIIMAVTWPEVTGNHLNYTPSPMAIGRADVSSSNGKKLWADGVVSGAYKYVRAHWSAGVGIWQLDSVGLGADMSFHNAVLTNTSAAVVASEMARLYKSASGTAADKRKAAWKPWYACGYHQEVCEKVYQSIYYSPTDTLNITRDHTVSRGGGLVSKHCYNVSNPRVTWPCYKYNPALAQGYKGSWYYNPLNGSSTLEPVPLPFLTYWKTDSYGNKIEYRHWLKADTGYDTSKWASRLFGTNARSSVKWMSNSPLGAK